MFRYFVSLILLNTYYCSFGYPVTQNATRSLVAQPLLALANACNTSFLAEVIKTNIGHCSVSVQPNSQSELECLMFYEVTAQLCTDVHQPEINIKEHYTKKIANIENVETLCDNAKTWPLPNLEKYPIQKRLLEKVFNNKRACLKLCSVDDVLNDDSNFYCKFFQWGLDVIKSRSLTTAQQENTSGSTQNSLQNKTLATLIKSENVTQSKSNIIVKNLEPQLLNSEKPANKVMTNIKVNGQTPTNNKAAESISAVEKDIETIEHKKSEQFSEPSIKAESEKPAAVADEPPKKENVENMESEVPQQKEEVKPIMDNNQIKEDKLIDEDAESDFGNDQELDEDSEPDADNGNNQIVESDPKIETEKKKPAENNIESITSLQNTVQRESGIFPNPIQDSFADDDDHFFPLFLTAIILVVLLYILYHNKTKFTKVILGLIVEGRQTDRRRNSRGHSYRRLDTLEQAMSTNTAAPPSKIIY